MAKRSRFKRKRRQRTSDLRLVPLVAVVLLLMLLLANASLDLAREEQWRAAAFPAAGLLLLAAVGLYSIAQVRRRPGRR